MTQGSEVNDYSGITDVHLEQDLRRFLNEFGDLIVDALVPVIS